MSEQLVQFVADKPGPPPISPEARIALKLICGILAMPSVAAAVYVAFMNVGFLAGSAATPVGQLAGIFGGIIAALGLFMLLIAVGLTRTDYPAVAVMALILFGLCLAIALAAMSGFSMASSQPMKMVRNYETHHRPLREIRRDLANASNRCVFEGIQYHCDWRLRFSEELSQAHREDDTPPTPASEPTEFEVPGTGMIITASAKKFGNILSAWVSHLIIVAFASVGMAITLASAHALTKGPSISAPPSAAPVITRGPTERAFEEWADHYLVLDASHDAPAALLYLAYQLWCAAKGYPQYEDGDAFGRKLRPHVRAKFASVATEKSKGLIVYTGLNLRDDEFTQKARITFANGA